MIRKGGDEWLLHGGKMKRRMFFGSAVAGLLALKMFAQDSQHPDFSGVIIGRVLNEGGQPVAKAEVCANPTTIAWAGPLPCARSDSVGRFSIHVWRPDEYVMTAVKEKEGYPDTFNTFYGSSAVVLPRVTMIEDKLHQEVAIQLGPPFGKVIGKIVDADTGRPIESVTIDMHHTNNPANSIQMGIGYPKGRLRLLVPPVPIIFKLSTAGYQDWWYGGDGSENQAEALQVGLGSTRELIIALRPVNKDK